MPRSSGAISVPDVVAADARAPPAARRCRVSAAATSWRARQTAREPASGRARRERLDRHDRAVAARLAPARRQRMPPAPRLEVAPRTDADQLDRRRARRGERVEHRRDVALLAGARRARRRCARTPACRRSASAGAPAPAAPARASRGPRQQAALDAGRGVARARRRARPASVPGSRPMPSRAATCGSRCAQRRAAVDDADRASAPRPRTPRRASARSRHSASTTPSLCRNSSANHHSESPR